jgi:leader peptidase (prepilin peptidase)/N-methyltransferase
VVELACIALACAGYWRYGVNPQTVTAAVAMWWLTALVAMTWDEGTTPAPLVWPLAALGLIANLDGAFAPLVQAMLGLMAGCVVGVALDYARGRKGLAALAASVGVWLGLGGLLAALAILGASALIAKLIQRTSWRDTQRATLPPEVVLSGCLIAGLLDPGGLVWRWLPWP